MNHRIEITSSDGHPVSLTIFENGGKDPLPFSRRTATHREGALLGANFGRFQRSWFNQF